jgi:hypothetical protein
VSDKPYDKGQVIKKLIEAAKKEREDWLKTGEEISKYAYSKDHDFEYADFRGDLFFKATVAKTAEYIETVGPALYQNNPDRRVSTADWAPPESHARNALIQDLLNYTPRETDLSGHSRRSINDAITHGVGVAWTGYNPRKKLIQSVYDSVENLLLDPDAKCLEELNWGGRKRTKPKWWLLDKYPDAKDLIAGLRDETGGSGTSKQVDFYELYFRVGLHHFCDGQAVDKVKGPDGTDYPATSDAPKKYIVTGDGKLIAELDWEAPLFLDDKWPFEILTFRDKPKTVWSASPLETGLGFQKALNWIYSLYISKARFTTRTLLGLAKIRGEGLDAEQVRKAIQGTQLEVIEFEISGENVKLADFIQQFNFQTGVDEFERFVAIIERAFERATGLTELIATGQTQHQERSAAESQIKDRNSRTRFDDMRVRVESWATQLARKEAQMARFLMTPEDIAGIFGQQAGMVWGALVPPMNVQADALQQTAQRMGMTDPMQQQQYVQQNLQQGVVYQQWLLESDFTIEAGSTARRDIGQQQDSASEAMNQAVPALMQCGMIVPALTIMKAWAKINNMPEDVLSALNAGIQQATMPPPPPGMPPGVGPMQPPIARQPGQ